MANCTLECGDTVRLKACGGIGPYTWSSTGAVTLSSTHGIAISVSSTQVTLDDPNRQWNATAIAYIRNLVWTVTEFADNGDCGHGADPHLSLVRWEGVTGQGYNCDGTLITSNTFTTLATQHVTGEGSACSAALDAGIQHMPASGNNTGTLGPPYPSGLLRNTISLAAQNDRATVFSASVSQGAIAFPGTTVPVPGEWDIRTQTMVNQGCGCDLSGVTVTVRDAAGVQVTTILAI